MSILLCTVRCFALLMCCTKWIVLLAHGTHWCTNGFSVPVRALSVTLVLYAVTVLVHSAKQRILKYNAGNYNAACPYDAARLLRDN
jgi:hypothetical protein